jgi:hypothetical protein
VERRVARWRGKFRLKQLHMTYTSNKGLFTEDTIYFLQRPKMYRTTCKDTYGTVRYCFFIKSKFAQYINYPTILDSNNESA